MHRDDLENQPIPLIYPYVAALARRGRYREAESWLAVLLRLVPDAELHCLVGLVQAQQRRYAEAERSFRSAVALDPGHARATGALTRLERLRSAPWMPVGAWRVGSVFSAIGVVLLLGVLIPISFGGAPGGRGEVTGSALTRSAMPASGGQDGVSGPEADTGTRLFGEYVLLIDALRALPASPPLEAVPRMDAGQLTVRVTGAVPTGYVAALAGGAGQELRGLAIDATGVEVTHRYTVRPGDTLTSIARALYGDGTAWRELWAENQPLIANSDTIHPGTELVAP